MGRSAEMWFDAQEQQEDEQQPDTLAEELWQLGCAMNQARVDEITEADCMSRKESNLGRKP